MVVEYDLIDVECVNEVNMVDLGMNLYLVVGCGFENELFMSIIYYKGGELD